MRAGPLLKDMHAWLSGLLGRVSAKSEIAQAIGYSLGPDDTMLAYIEGPGPNGEIKRIEFAYKRVP